MASGRNPRPTRVAATSRRALSKASVGPPSWARQSPATTIEAQLLNGLEGAPAAKAGPAKQKASNPMIAKSPLRTDLSPCTG